MLIQAPIVAAEAITKVLSGGDRNGLKIPTIVPRDEAYYGAEWIHEEIETALDQPIDSPSHLIPLSRR